MKPQAIQRKRLTGWIIRTSGDVLCLSCRAKIDSRPEPHCASREHKRRYLGRLDHLKKWRRKKRQAIPRYGAYAPELRRQIERAKVRAIRAKIHGWLGNECWKCGASDTRVLQIHHRKGGGSKERREHGWNYLRYLNRLSFQTLRKRYQLLCANCHAIATWEENR